MPSLVAIVDLGLAITVIALAAVGITGTSTDKDVIQNTHWTRQKMDYSAQSSVFSSSVKLDLYNSVKAAYMDMEFGVSVAGFGDFDASEDGVIESYLDSGDADVLTAMLAIGLAAAFFKVRPPTPAPNAHVT